MRRLVDPKRDVQSLPDILQCFRKPKRSASSEHSTISGADSSESFSSPSTTSCDSPVRSSCRRPSHTKVSQNGEGKWGSNFTWRELGKNVSAEMKLFGNRIFDVLLIFPAIRAAFFFTNLATYRHETMHQFCSRGGLYDGENDTNNFPVGTNMDRYRARDFGFEMIPEEHSEAAATIIDIIPPYIGIGVFLPMFIGAVFRKFNEKKKKERMFMSLLADSVILMSIMISARAIFFISTSLPAPDRECVRGLRDYNEESSPSHNAEGLHHNPTCGDLIYSGHFSTSYAFFMFYVTESYRFFRGESKFVKALRYLYGATLAVIIAVQVYYILATRHHYTVDIVVVPFVDYFVRWCILENLGLGYTRFVNRSAILFSPFIGFRAFGRSYVKALRDPLHNGPSEKFRKVGFAVFWVVVIGCIIALLAISATLFLKLERVCVGLETDAYCRFVHNHIWTMWTLPNYHSEF